MSAEEPGLLGNLPRSRPGQRSAKRAATAKSPAKEASTAKESAAAARDGADGDPVGDALRAAARTAEVGLRAANDVTREILRRLPRP